MKIDNNKGIVSIMLTPMFIIICMIILFGLGMYYIDDIKDNVFYNSILECNLISEQRVACYNGCTYNQLEYSDCINYCENTYYTEFDDDGDISSCHYN